MEPASGPINRGVVDADQGVQLRQIAALNEKQAMLLTFMHKKSLKWDLGPAFYNLGQQTPPEHPTFDLTDKTHAQLVAEQAEVQALLDAVFAPKPKRKPKPKPAQAVEKTGLVNPVATAASPLPETDPVRPEPPSQMKFVLVDDEPNVVRNGGTPYFPASAVAHPTPILGGDRLTMTSLEIAELVESRHDVVKQSIERLANRGVISLPPLVEVKIRRERREETVSVYQIGKRDSYVIVAQLSPEFTARLVDRWQELEQQTLVTPANLSRLQLIEMAMQSEKECLALAGQNAAMTEQLAVAAPKAEALDLISGSAGMFSLRDAAKMLKQRPMAFNEWLRDELRWMYCRLQTTFCPALLGLGVLRLSLFFERHNLTSSTLASPPALFREYGCTS